MAEPDRTQDQGPIFSRIVRVDDALSPLEGQFTANEEERRNLASFFRIESLEVFSIDYRLEPQASGRYRLKGEIAADLIQLCVVTLEPVAEHIQEPIDLAFWPEAQIAKYEIENAALTVGDHLPEDPPEPIVNGRIDIGALSAEILASAINPYPRKPDIDFEWSDPAETDEHKQANPFAALAKLKSKQ